VDLEFRIMSKEISVLGSPTPTIVDDEDFEYLSKYKWTLSDGYVKRAQVKRYSSTAVLMHREIMQPPKHLYIDHINHNKLDNRKENLRIVSLVQNIWNKVYPKKGSFKYTGVTFRSATGKWRARLGSISIGDFQTEIEAAMAYNKKALEVRGEFAILNLL